MSTRRENMLSVFRHEVPEWTPVVGHVDPYNQPNRRGMDPDLAEALGTVRWCDESTVVFSRYLGLDIMDYLNPPLRSARESVTTESVQEDCTTITTWHTPEGDLREVRRLAREDGTSYLTERMVKGPEDLPALASMFEDEKFELDPEGVDRVKRRRQLIGDDGMLMFFLPGTPMGMLVRVYSGVAALAYLWADCPGELRSLFKVMGENHRRQFELAASLEEADALVGMDDTSTTTISPGMFEEFCLDYTDRVADIAHMAGKLYFHHSCGLIRDLLHIYRQTRMDAVHAFTIPPIGDVTIGEGRRRLGDRAVIIAGLVQLFGNMGDRAAIARSIAAMFEESEPGDHFILALAADPEKDMEQTRFIAEQCEKHPRRAAWSTGA